MQKRMIATTTHNAILHNNIDNLVIDTSTDKIRRRSIRIDVDDYNSLQDAGLVVFAHQTSPGNITEKLMIDGKQITLQRFILGARDGDRVLKRGDNNDYRKHMLQLKRKDSDSKYIGVIPNADGSFDYRVQHSGLIVTGGPYGTEDEAALARDFFVLSQKGKGNNPMNFDDSEERYAKRTSTRKGERTLMAEINSKVTNQTVKSHRLVTIEIALNTFPSLTQRHLNKLIRDGVVRINIDDLKRWQRGHKVKTA